MRRLLPLTLLVSLSLLTPAQAQQNPPSFDYASIMKTYCDDTSGLMQLGDYVVAFSPAGPFNGEVAVINSKGETLGRFPFYPDKNVEDGVFARVRVQGPAEVNITTPGIYNLIFLAGGKPVTRFPFVVKEKKSGDEFRPETTYQFDGLWRSMAYLTVVKNGDRNIPVLNFWVGGLDLPEGESRGMYQVTLSRGGKVVATSKKDLGSIAAGHFKFTTANLFHPHEDRQQANAGFFTMKDLTNGAYEIRVNRQSDGQQLRSFNFKVAQRKIQNLPRTASGFEPALDYIPPRVPRRNVTVFEMEEAFWLQELD